jgi:hypothetical protein
VKTARRTPITGVGSDRVLDDRAVPAASAGGGAVLHRPIEEVVAVTEHNDAGREAEPDADQAAYIDQVRALEEEVLALRRRLQDAPKRVRTLEERLLETKGQLAQAVAQNEKLTYTLREARDHIGALREEVDKLTQPPSAYGTLLTQNDDGTVDVYSGGRKMRVAVHPALDVDELVRGGEVVLNEWDPRNETCNFRTMFGPRGRDRGLGTEAVRLLVGYGFERLGLHRIGLEVYSFNPRARRAYEKAGFVAEGVRRDALRTPDGRADATVMSILADEWKGGQDQQG